MSVSVILIISDLMRIRTLETFKMNEQPTHRSNALLKRFERCILL